jgi:hypothetical protein
MFSFKQFQREDIARAALHDGVILGIDTGGGKTIAAFTWTALKTGFQFPADALRPLQPVLIIAPGDLHQQIIGEGRDHFRAEVTRLDSQRTFLRLARINPQGGYTLDPGYYLTSYTQLTGNGVQTCPEPEDDDAPACIGQRRHYGGGGDLPEFAVKCVYSPSLVDLCQDCFAAVAVDEGVRMKGEDTIIGAGVRQLTASYRLVLTATPIKNRLPDVFRLAWWATGGHREAHARFPYPDQSAARDEFAREFMVSERNLSREEKAAASGNPRRFVKLTPQVCNVHRLWKLFAPIILRRRKADFGEPIVTKTRQVVHVPMGLDQARVYRYHLDARYLDRNGRPAAGAKLQALRVASANPASRLLQRPGDDTTPGLVRSAQAYIPKVHSALKLIQQVLERGEQVVVFSAFHSSLDELSSRLAQAGVPHCKLDGRMSQNRRAREAAEFKKGPPRLRSQVSGLNSPVSDLRSPLSGLRSQLSSLFVSRHAGRGRVHGRRAQLSPVQQCHPAGLLVGVRQIRAGHQPGAPAQQPLGRQRVRHPLPGLDRPQTRKPHCREERRGRTHPRRQAAQRGECPAAEGACPAWSPDSPPQVSAGLAQTKSRA